MEDCKDEDEGTGTDPMEGDKAHTPIWSSSAEVVQGRTLKTSTRTLPQNTWPLKRAWSLEPAPRKETRLRPVPI